MKSFFQSTIGKKIVVAVSGLLMLGFVVAHLLGNLQIFSGAEKINAYATFLHNSKELLWGTRIFLLGTVIVHISTAISLFFHNRASRVIPYEMKSHVKANPPSRWMLVSGLVVGAYVVFHVLNLTHGFAIPDFRPLDIYHNLISNFKNPWLVVIYAVAMGALGFHLFHALFGVCQTLGINNPYINKYRRPVAILVAAAVVAGYFIIPVAIVLGLLR